MTEPHRPTAAAPIGLFETLREEVHRLLASWAADDKPTVKPEGHLSPVDTTLPAAGGTFDREAFALWTLVGLRLFDGEAPTWRVAIGETRHLLVRLALARDGGNITRMARRLGSSRRAVREALRVVKGNGPSSDGSPLPR